MRRSPPLDPSLVLAALKEATPEQRRLYRARLGELGGVPPCRCSNEDPVLCKLAEGMELGFGPEQAAKCATEAPCICACHAGAGRWDRPRRVEGRPLNEKAH